MRRNAAVPTGYARYWAVVLVRRTMLGLVTYRTVRSPVRTVKILLKWRRDARALPLRARVHLLDYMEIHHSMLMRLGRFPRLVRPQDFNDKVQWLKLFAQRPEMVLLVDKIAVRDWVSERIGPGHLIPLRASASDWSDLPAHALKAPFVVKAAHDSGSTVIVKNDDLPSLTHAERAISRARRRRYGTVGAEWAYRSVRPRILVEDMLGDGSVAPADYRFFCVRGEVKVVQKHWGHREGASREATFDARGRELGIRIKPENVYVTAVDIPGSWDLMVNIARKLSSDYEFVRVDLFCVDETVYFGELTFWPFSGYYGGDQQQLGDLVDVNTRIVDANTRLTPRAGANP